MLELIFQGLAAPFASAEALIEAGGWVLPWIFLAALIMWTLIAERWWFFRITYPLWRRELLREWKARADHRSWYARQIRRMMISRADSSMFATLPLIRVLVPICPLLGLLGTVTGMLEVFDAMALRGSADARTMAYGVMHAMVATLAGLVVGLSGIFFVGRFYSRVRVETELLADALKF